MIAFTVWIRMQIIFWFFVPIIVYHYLGWDKLCGIASVVAAVTAFVFGLPGIVGNSLYLGLLSAFNVSRQYFFIYLLLGFPFITLCCVFHLFLWMSSSFRDAWTLFYDLSGFVIAVVIATVLSTFSCYRLLFNCIYPVLHDKTV